MKLKNFFIIILLSLFIGCGTDGKLNDNLITSVHSTINLPDSAKVIEELGNGWVIFTLNGNKFLYRQYSSGYRGYSSLTQIIEKDSL